MSIQTVASPREGWKWVTLADVAKVVTGNTPPTADAQNYGDAIPFVKPTELVDRGIRFAPAGLAEQALGKARVVPAGAVLVSCIGNLGKTGLAKVPLAFNQQINAVVFNENVVPEFGFYYAQTLKSWLYGESSATTLPIVNKGKFQQAPFPLAPITEQREIVAELEKQFSRLDEAVANLQRVKANLKRYKASILKDAVEGRLVPTEAELARREGRSFETGGQLLQRILAARRRDWIGRGKYRPPISADMANVSELPAGWSWSSLDQLTSKITSGSRDWSQYYGRGTGTFVLAQNVRPFNPDFSARQFVDPPSSDPSCDRSRVQDDDLLATIVGANAGQICLVAKAPSEAYVCQSVALIRPVNRSTSAYLNYWLNSSDNGQRYLDKCMYGQGRPHLSFEQLMAVPIALPPLVEQKRIGAEVARRLSLIDSVETEVDANLKRAQALRQATLSTAFQPKL